eukprot:COSAG02_NODE_1126_length_14431_cov_37.854452_12_plen_70_part_00
MVGMLLRTLSTLALLAAVANAFPSHYHSCTFNFTGGTRLPFPYCELLDDLDHVRKFRHADIVDCSIRAR